MNLLREITTLIKLMQLYFRLQSSILYWQHCSNEEAIALHEKTGFWPREHINIILQEYRDNVEVKR